jgi:predicted hotdog family 3-hydroxylacyl-ACP dehydratase
MNRPNSAPEPDIGTLVPHDGPMLLLDRLVSIDVDTLCAEVIITPASLFAGEQGVGTWIGIEYMAQAIAAWAGYHGKLRNESVKIGFLLGARRYESTQPFFPPGSVLHIHIKQLFQADNGLGSFDCTIRYPHAQETLANAIVSVFQPDNAKEFLEGSMP